MSSTQGKTFILNGVNYDSDQLPPAGQDLLELLNDAQQELQKLDKQRTLLQAAQQHLIKELKALLPQPALKQPDGACKILGTSTTIPTTSTKKPSELPAPFPANIPSDIKSKNK